jgi:hypothetical protein
MSQKIWNNEVTQFLRHKYGLKADVVRPRNINFTLNQRTITIENTWYDLLVLPMDIKTKTLNGNDDVFHCVEVKWSDKGNLGSFGAFTLGEWIAASLSLSKSSNFSYEILYVWRKHGTIKIEEIKITKALLEDMFQSPQLKLYFQASLIKKHLSSTTETLVKEVKDNKLIKQYLLKVKNLIEIELLS